MSAEELVRAMVEGKPLPEKTLYDLCWREYKDCLPEIVEVQHDEGLVREGKQRVYVVSKLKANAIFVFITRKHEIGTALSTPIQNK